MTAHEITVMEVSPRDGLQNESALLSTEDKLELIDRSLASGAKRIEVTSFVHPKRGAADGGCGSGRSGPAAARRRHLHRPGAQSSRLRAASGHRAAERSRDCDPCQRYLWRTQSGHDASPRALPWRRTFSKTPEGGRRFRAQVTIAVAFGCPFEGDVDRETVLDMARRLAEAGPVEIGLADTIGVGVPVSGAGSFRRFEGGAGG